MLFHLYMSRIKKINRRDTKNKISKTVDIVYVSFCMDVFDAPYAPGVSAPTIMGLDPKKGKRILRSLMEETNRRDKV